MRKNDYIKTIQDMHMPDDMRARIVHRMAQENGHKEVPISMFKHKKKRMAAAVIAATVVVGGSAFAFGGTAISRIFASSSASADYTSLPSAQQCQRDAGFTPALLQSFDNGFAFKDGVIVHNQEQNEDGQTVNKYASLEFDYQKGDETVSLMQNSGASQEEETGKKKKKGNWRTRMRKRQVEMQKQLNTEMLEKAKSKGKDKPVEKSKEELRREKERAKKISDKM